MNGISETAEREPRNRHSHENPDSAEALAARMSSLQQELIDRTSRRENYDDLAEEILHLREV